MTLAQQLRVLVLMLALAALPTMGVEVRAVIQWQSVTSGAWADTDMALGLNPHWARAAFYRLGWDSSSVFILQSTDLQAWSECYRCGAVNANGQQWRLVIR